MRIPAALLVSLLACCTAAYTQGSADAQKTARALKGDSKGAAANNPQCKLFSAADASRYIGATVSTMENAGMGYGCQWAVGGGKGAMMVSVLPAGDHEPPKLAKGFKKLPDVGAQGFVLPEMGGWGAGAIAGERAIRVSLDGPGASEAKVVDLLKETIKRRSASPSK